MDGFIFFDEKTRDALVNARAGETKWGQKLKPVSDFESLKTQKADFVLFGIPEDIGVRANFGKAGAATTWDSFLAAFLNIQANAYNDPDKCLVLGHIDCSRFMDEAERILEKEENPQEKLGAIVSRIDAQVSAIVRTIIASGKTPVIIGGGHNNAFGNIKGAAEAVQDPVNILNIDAHTDLRTTDYRHSGNGFSYAKKENYMARYAMFGIHKNYTPRYIFEACKSDPKTKIVLFEAMLRKDPSQKQAKFQETMAFLENRFGLEIDCDAIKDFSSSAMSPAGFSLTEIRNFISIAKTGKVHYLHLCEAAAKGNPQIGKALSYICSDFMEREE